MAKPAVIRAVAAQTLQQVLQHGRSLSAALPQTTQALGPSERSWVQALCYEVMRELPSYEWLIQQLLDKPLKAKVRIIHYLIMVGLCQLRTMRTAEHAAIGETVEAALVLKQKAMKGLVNGVLRNYQRQQEVLEQQLEHALAGKRYFPRWLQDAITAAYPDQAETILHASQSKGPMWLRVNAKHMTGERYLELLRQQSLDAIGHEHLPQALRLTQPCDVNLLPGFAEGMVSVQDISAQWCGHYLAPTAGMRVLDACAAPGGKSALLLEQFPDITLDALDFDAERLTRVHDNLARLRLDAEVIHGDAAKPESWWSKKPYDAILLDAPCSATGVIRRHPDIKWLRRADDIPTLVALQAEILDAQWSLLKPGGILVYATCSLLPAENSQQVAAFMARHADAEATNRLPVEGRQILPGEDEGDGFYYAVLRKAVC